VQYNTGFLLPDGKYKLRFIIRENQSGRLGSFETEVTIPDLRKAPLKLSSLVLASQRVPAKKSGQNPLVRDGAELIPNITHVFSSDQRLYVQLEVYDAEKAKKPAQAPNTAAQNGQQKPEPKQDEKPSGQPVRVLTSIQFFQGKLKVYETPLIEAQQVNDSRRRAVVFQLDVPLAQLKPGYYMAQVTVVDDAAGSFAFPRTSLLVRAPEKDQAQPTVASPTGN
jgi:hypothetical protein